VTSPVDERARAPQDEGGFTLIETIITVTILGLIATVIAGAFVVVARTSPAAEARIDDSRSLLGLTNWLSQDVASTSESGFDVGDDASSCDPASIPTSKGLIELTWGTSVANYRWVPGAPGTGSIWRFTCSVGSTAQALKVTAELNEVDTASSLSLKPAPVKIGLLGTTTGNAGHGGLEFFVYVVQANGTQRELLRLDAATRNVRSTLPPIPGGGSGTGSNRAPLGEPFAVPAERGSMTVFAPLPIDDADSDELIAVWDDSTVPAAWDPQITYDTLNLQWQLIITTQPADSGSYSFTYHVCDRLDGDPDQLCSVDSEITVNIVEPVNHPPTADPFAIDVEANQPVVDVKMPVGDEDPGSLTIGFRSPVPNGWNPTVAFKTVAGVEGWYLSFVTDPADDGSHIIQYRVTDDIGSRNASPSNQGWVELTVTVTPAPIDNPPTAGIVNTTVAAGSAGSLALPVTDESPSTLTYELRNAPPGWNTSVAGGTLAFQTSFAHAGTFVFEYRVRDAALQYNSSATSGQGWVAATVTVNNGPPTAGPVSVNGSKGVQLSINLPAADPETQALAVSFPARPTGWPTPTVTQNAGVVSATFTPPPTASGINTYTYRVTDSAGQFVDSTIIVTMCSVTITNVNTSNSNPAGIKSDLRLNRAITVTISTNGACSSLVLGFHPANSFSDAPDSWASFGGTTQAVILANAYTWYRGWSGNGKQQVALHVRQGITGLDETTGIATVEKV